MAGTGGTPAGGSAGAVTGGSAGAAGTGGASSSGSFSVLTYNVAGPVSYTHLTLPTSDLV